jgi:hypothetical protein
MGNAYTDLVVKRRMEEMAEDYTPTAELNATFVRFEDLAGNPIAVRQVVIKVNTTTWEIDDIVAEA